VTSEYPEENIVRDVAGYLLADHLRRMITTELPQQAAALLITRAGEVRRTDLVAAMVHGATLDLAVRQRLLVLLEQALPELREQLLAYCHDGPVPTPEAYTAASAAAAVWRDRAIAAGWTEPTRDLVLEGRFNRLEAAAHATCDKGCPFHVPEPWPLAAAYAIYSRWFKGGDRSHKSVWAAIQEAYAAGRQNGESR
jgi:hypothetical protein